MPMIELPPTENVRLIDLLAILSTGKALRWSIMEMWAVAADPETDVVALEQQAATSPTGLTMSQNELETLSGQLLQLIDGIIVGFDGDPPHRRDDDLREKATVVIEAIDSTYWRVYARLPATLDQVRQGFPSARDVAPEPPIRATHQSS